MKTILAPTLRRDKPWLATWLQGRRRKRLALSAPSGSLVDLENGLHLWFDAADGACRVGSYGETDLPGDDELLGGSWNPGEITDSGSYVAGDQVRYYISPYKLVDGVKVYLAFMADATISMAGEAEGSGVEFPEWEDTAPVGVDGYTIVRWVNVTALSYRHVAMATMMGGFVDTGAGWTPGLPWSFASPMVARKLAWCRHGQGTEPVGMPVVVGPLGDEAAFDSTLGNQLVHGHADDEMRLAAWTLAFWVRPSEVGGGALVALRGVTQAPLNMSVGLDTEAGTVAMGDGGELAFTGHVPGSDWYFVVVRNDAATATMNMKAWRQRDGATATNENTEAGDYRLTAESDYFLEALHGGVSFGSSWMWSSDSRAAFCRMGLWSRALSDDEVESLWNLGLGWRPGS